VDTTAFMDRIPLQKGWYHGGSLQFEEMTSWPPGWGVPVRDLSAPMEQTGHGSADG
jgi:hypothetical protein